MSNRPFFIRKKYNALTLMMVLAWDPDFIKLTPNERKELYETIKDGGYVSIDNINWDLVVMMKLKGKI